MIFDYDFAWLVNHAKQARADGKCAIVTFFETQGDSDWLIACILRA